MNLDLILDPVALTQKQNRELEAGMDIEMEHEDSLDPNARDKAKKTANDHLKTEPHYYSKLMKAGLVDEPEAKMILLGYGDGMREGLDDVKLNLSEEYATYTCPHGHKFILTIKNNSMYSKVVARMGKEEAGNFRFKHINNYIIPYDEDEGVAIEVKRNHQRMGLATAMVKYAMIVTHATKYYRSSEETSDGQEFFSSLTKKKRIGV